MGEHDRHGIVWDYIAIYQRGTAWENGPPEAIYHGGPVVQVTEQARAALDQALAGKPALIR